MATILCDLNPRWKLGADGAVFQVWKKDPANGRFFIHKEIDSTRRELLRYLENNAIYPTSEAKKVLEGLPERLVPFAPDIEEGS